MAVTRAEVEIAPGLSTVDVSFTVPDATPENLLVCWDDESNCIAVRVARATSGGATHDWYIELPLPLTVDGAKSKCALEGAKLRIRAPLNDTPGGTGLAIDTFFANVINLQTALAEA